MQVVWKADELLNASKVTDIQDEAYITALMSVFPPNNEKWAYSLMQVYHRKLQEALTDMGQDDFCNMFTHYTPKTYDGI